MYRQITMTIEISSQYITQPIWAYKSLQNINSNIYAQRDRQKVTLLHINVNPSKHQDRPSVATERISSQKTGDTHPSPTNAGPPYTTLAQHQSEHRADVPRPLDCVTLDTRVISVTIHSDGYDPYTTTRNAMEIFQNMRGGKSPIRMVSDIDAMFSCILNLCDVNMRIAVTCIVTRGYLKGSPSKRNLFLGVVLSGGSR